MKQLLVVATSRVISDRAPLDRIHIHNSFTNLYNYYLKLISIISDCSTGNLNGITINEYAGFTETFEKVCCFFLKISKEVYLTHK